MKATDVLISVLRVRKVVKYRNSFDKKGFSVTKPTYYKLVMANSTTKTIKEQKLFYLWNHHPNGTLTKSVGLL